MEASPVLLLAAFGCISAFYGCVVHTRLKVARSSATGTRCVTIVSACGLHSAWAARTWQVNLGVSFWIASQELSLAAESSSSVAGLFDLELCSQ